MNLRILTGCGRWIFGRTGALVVPAAAVVLLLGQACNDGSPTSGSMETVAIQVSMSVAGTPINTLVVEVTGADFAMLVFNLVVENGSATGTIRIPPGTARTIHVTAFDSEGNITHEGTATIDVSPGQNPPVQIPMVPRAGQVPVTATFGEYSVTVTPAEATLVAGTPLQLSAEVRSSDGGVVMNPLVSWASTNPAAATVDASGLVTGHMDGVASVVATFEGVAGLSHLQMTGFGAGPPLCGSWTWVPTNVDPCNPALPPPASALSLTGASEVFVYDTNTGVMSASSSVSFTPSSALIHQSDGSSVRVMTCTGFELSAETTLQVTGSYPLIVLVDGSATIDGTLDVSANGSLPGPSGNDPNGCDGSGQDGASHTFGNGGGGGAFGTDGGNGGTGGPTFTDIAFGGHASGNDSISPLRGGCGGGAGGPCAGCTGTSVPGAGGGAIQIIARQSLRVAGSIRSAGGGGQAGPNGAGGAGGGAGGAILLEADDMTIAASASVCANGGSGGEGGASQPGGDGMPGTCSASTPASTTDVPSNANGGAGGAGGGAAELLPGDGETANGFASGGGGGGGSVGRIRVRGVTTRVIENGAVVTPPPAS